MNDIKDAKPPLNLPDFWWVLWLLLALLAIAVVVYFLLRYKPRLKAAAAPVEPELPPWEKAYHQLDLLKRENLLEKGLSKEFFTRVADIARVYMENRFNIRAPHMTTDEFLYYLGVTGHLNEAQNNSLKDFLNSCDMVKFAKYAPTMHEAWRNFDLAKKLVDDTRI